MSIVKADSRHIVHILRVLALTPNPPNETEESIQAILDDPSQFTYIDLVVPVLCRMAPMPDVKEVSTPWWIWTGTFGRVHIPIISAVARAVKAEFPRSGTWPTYGDFPGEGTSSSKRLLDSKRQADEIVAKIAGITAQVSPRNPSMYEDLTTIDDLIAMVIP